MSYARWHEGSEWYIFVDATSGLLEINPSRNVQWYNRFARLTDDEARQLHAALGRYVEEQDKVKRE